jgi:carbamoylphosphate synthase small subunit
MPAQVVTFTFPHIGNVGVNEEDLESPRRWRNRLRGA